jgi:hypothetical protein
MDTIKDKAERMKVLAELFLKEDKRVFIIDINNEWYFADILIIGEERLLIQCFSPEQKKGLKFDLPWISIIKFEEYKEMKGGSKNE